jgi:O-antigen biosynthesis protein
VLEQLGGFDPCFVVTCGDTDYCLRAGEFGYRTIYDPAAVLYHLESKTRGSSGAGGETNGENSDERRFRARWGARILRDPFYNPNFERHSSPFTRIRLLNASQH